MNDRKIYVRLGAGIKRLFWAAYAFIDSDEINSLHLFREIGMKVKFGDCYKPAEDPEGLGMMIVYVPRKRMRDFEECMETHKRNSILLGWGNSEQCQKMIDDMHRCAESE